jgi:hypothetical protein
MSFSINADLGEVVAIVGVSGWHQAVPNALIRAQIVRSVTLLV